MIERHWLTKIAQLCKKCMKMERFPYIRMRMVDLMDETEDREEMFGMLQNLVNTNEEKMIVETLEQMYLKFQKHQL